jgi:hypothetical protein
MHPKKRKNPNFNGKPCFRENLFQYNKKKIENKIPIKKVSLIGMLSESILENSNETKKIPARIIGGRKSIIKSFNLMFHENNTKNNAMTIRYPAINK